MAKALAAIDVLSEGRLVAALGPGSSERDYRVFGIPFEERWKRFDEALAVAAAGESRSWPNCISGKWTPSSTPPMLSASRWSAQGATLRSPRNEAAVDESGACP